ncbi:hypothetical protein [Parabacteroides sp. PF5-6]|uniref:hypothetical protein n=1 Tax=Parabacteroides sp. PF5-6 TaxID=1742403 RepID=UPI002407367F|nr:hypothetical protein [Parabacteroides sp. PF5-6]MDF9831334.1 glucosamine 6-phosphate synthetase-like amidotransferase/phosphosugar isomerase protein [Parabacteroides sp. PF5-6]
MSSKQILSGEFEHNETAVKVQLGVYLFKEMDSYIVYCPALDLSAYGDSEYDAQKAFTEKLEITFKYCMNKNTLVKDLKQHGWDIKSKSQSKIKAPSLEEMLQKNEALKDILENKEYSVYKQNVDFPQFA